MSDLNQSLARSRHAERYRNERVLRAHRDPGLTPPPSARSRAGWWLVGLGLRLALPADRRPAHRITLLGR
jgi:hypothetical protein